MKTIFQKSLSSDKSHKKKHGGAGEDRTPDPLRARQVLSQLSYDPFFFASAFYLPLDIKASSLSHIQPYAPSRACIDSSFEVKLFAKYSS